MNRIVRDRYPVERLPEDLRETLDPARPASVVIAQPTEDRPIPDGIGSAYAGLVEGFRAYREQLEAERRDRPVICLADLGGYLRNIHGREQDVVDHIRAMRDEE